MGGFANNAPIVTDGLVFYVDAGNDNSYPGSGTTWSDLVGGNDGTLTNGPTYDSGNGGGIVFDGTNDYIALSEGGLSFPNDSADFTLSVFIKANQGDISSQGVFQQSDGGGTGRTWIGVSADTDRFYSYLGASRLELTSITVSDNTIYNVILKYESGVLHIGYNGTWHQSSTRSIDENCTGDFILGSGKSGSLPMEGNIYTVSIYDKALSSAEVLQNYNALKNRFV